MCDFDGCDHTFAGSGALKIHKRTHTGARPYKCDFAGCGFASVQSGNLATHKRRHTGEKPYKCDFEGCDYACTTRSNLTVHTRTHTGEKPHVCDFEGCDYTSTTGGHLTVHKRTHTGEKPYKCDFEGCDYACADSGGIVTHKRTHTGEKPYVCDFEGCDYTCTTSGALVTHKRTHTGERPYPCADANCDYAAAKPGQAKKHYASWHSVEAGQRRRTAEHAVQKALTAAGIACSREQRVEYGCGLGVDKRYASIDFVLYMEDRVILLEVDEDQHKDYGVGCDAARMSHVHSALVANNPDCAIIFLRFNPTPHRVDGTLVKIPTKERHATLVQTLRQLQKKRTRGNMAPGQLSIKYLFYDERMNKQGTRLQPCLLDDPEFPKGLAPCVKRRRLNA